MPQVDAASEGLSPVIRPAWISRAGANEPLALVRHRSVRAVPGRAHPCRPCACCTGPASAFQLLDAKLISAGHAGSSGTARAQSDDAERAVRAGLEIEAAVSSLEARGTEPRAIRIGIDTGPVVVGDPAGEGSAQEQAEP